MVIILALLSGELRGFIVAIKNLLTILLEKRSDVAIIAAFAVRWIVLMKSMLLFLLSFFLISPQSLASDMPLDEQQNSANSSVKELVVGRQYGVHNCLWRPATVGENNTTYQDIAFQFAQSIGAKVTYHYFSDRDELLFALYKGKIDMAMG